VVGSGASGLAAAFRLQQAGHRVRVLEQADRIGSTLRSRRERGFLLDQGAFFLASSHTRLLRILEEAGMLDQLVAGPLGFGTLEDGAVHQLTSDHLVRDLRRTKLIEASLRALYVAPPGSRSRVDLLSAIKLMLSAKMLALRGGMGAYPARLAERFEIELRAEALEVVEGSEAVQLTWRDGSGAERVEPVDALVLAVPATAVSGLLPALDPWRAEFLGEVRGGHVINVNVATGQAPDGIGASYVQVPRPAHRFLSGIVMDHNKAPERAPEGAGLLTLVAMGEWSQEHLDDDDATISGELLDALQTVLPGAIRDVLFVGVNRWTQQFHPIGHYRRLGRFRELCESEDQRIQLAGDLHSPQNLESATVAGEHAAQRLLTALSRRRTPVGARAAAMRQAAGRSPRIPASH
jgi:oxygen-dependent protoporphyrinogen oxidase